MLSDHQPANLVPSALADRGDGCTAIRGSEISGELEDRSAMHL